MDATVEERIDQARGFAATVIARLRPDFPIRNEDGSYPIITTIPDEPLLHCARRADVLGKEVNLLVVSGYTIQTCVLSLSHDGKADENTILLPANSSYTVGQYINDSLDLGVFHPVKAMDGIGMVTDSEIDTLVAA